MKLFKIKVLLLFTLVTMSINGLTQSTVTNHGALSVSGNRIVNQYGDTVSFAGNSMFWSNTGWEGAPFYNASCVSWLQSDWNATIVRAAMGVEDNGGYLMDTTNKTRLKAVVDAAIANDLYVIIDWHSHHAENYQAEAIAFFQEMATLYGAYDNVIYEIYNEPLQVSWSNTIKPYAQAVTAAIRAIDPDNLIVVGTPTWSQDVDVASLDPITGFSNIAYTLHFYAGTHGQSLRNKAITAMNNGIALFVTEWGTVNANGNGGVATTSVNEWTTFMCQNKLSHCNWSICDKNEGASAVTPGASPLGNWSPSNLTASGAFVKTIIETWDANCNAQVSLVANDAGISNVVSPIGDICSDSISPEITLNNYGSSDLSSVTINYNIDNGPNSTYTWTGILTSGQSVVINLPIQYVSSGAHSLNVFTNSPNGVFDSVSVNDAEMSSFTIMGQGVLAQLNLQTDCWADEVSWSLVDSQNNQIDSGSGYTNGAAGAFVSQQYCLVDSCYTFTINDSYGDGINGMPSGCPINGDYNILNVATGDTLASMIGIDGAYGFQEVNPFCIGQSCSLSAISNVINQTCANQNDGEISVAGNNGTGSYSYTMGAVVNGTGLFENLSPGTYQIVVSDGTGCQTVITETIASASTFGSVDPDLTICNGDQVVIGAYGGASYLWSEGLNSLGSSSTITVAPTTNSIYVVNVSNGVCVESYDVTVTVTNLPNAGFTTTDFCEGGTNVVSNIATTGGSFTYNGTDASSIDPNSGIISNGISGTNYGIMYSVVQNGCTNQFSQSVTVLNSPQVDAGMDVDVCYGQSVALTAINPDNATISWNNGVVDNLGFVPVGTDNYVVTASLNGCSSSDNVSVNIIPLPSVGAGNDFSICDGDQATLVANNPGNAVISWDNNVIDGQPFSPISSSILYTVTATLNGCSNTDQVIINTQTTPMVSAGQDITTCAGDTVILLAANPDNASISWDNGVTDGVLFTVQSGLEVYTVTADLNGCIASDQVMVMGTDAPIITGVVTNDDGSNSGAIDVTISSGYTISSISWSNNSSTEDLVNLPTGTYTITVEDQNGCTSNKTFVVTSSVGIGTEELSSVLVYPNPVIDKLNIEFEGTFNLKIFDVSGKIVIDQIGTDAMLVNLSNVAPGTYYLVMENTGIHMKLNKI